MSLARTHSALLKYRSWLAALACVWLLAQWSGAHHRHEVAEPPQHACVVCLLGQTAAATGPTLLFAATVVATFCSIPFPIAVTPRFIYSLHNRGPPA